MPLAQIESIISVSNEDPSYPAKNLLTSVTGNNVKKWISSNKGEKDLSVIFKLKEKTTITNVTVGNENTAIIEILVGNDETKENEYQVLLPTTELQTVQDVRAGKNRNGVYFYTTQDFKSDVANRLWGRVKVVCNQPYDSYTKFGLSCFLVKSIKNEDNREELKENTNTNTVEPKIEIVLGTCETSSPIVDNNRGECSTKNVKKEMNGIINDNVKVKTEEEKKLKQEDNKPEPPKKDFSKILEDVRFSMSGYENPLRSELRDKAQGMGARYCVNWNMSCTHLICAFLNTPKFKEVKSSGVGKIVVKDWIEQCYGKRRRLPWRRFALENNELKLPVSEEDEEEPSKGEQSKKYEKDRRKRLPSSSSSDTEDEIQRIRTKNARKQLKNDTPKNKKPDLNDLYNADTDEDSDHSSSMLGDNTDSDEDYEPEEDSSRRRKKGLKRQQRRLCDVSIEEEDEEDSTDEEIEEDSIDEETEDYSSEETTPQKKRRKQNKMPKTKVKGRKPDTSDIPLPHLPDVPSRNYFIAKDEKGEYRNQLQRYIHALNGLHPHVFSPNRADALPTPVPQVNNLFGRHSFYIASDLSDSKRGRIKNCIDSFQWEICDELSNDVDFAITDDLDVSRKIISKYPKVKAVKSDWIWKCSDEDSLVSHSEFLWK